MTHNKMNFTDEQLSAIETGNCNMLVSAAAGSGKTRVLVERVIRKVLVEKKDIDRFLVVTFTEAAASEMKERIERTLVEALGSRTNREFVQRQLL
jgi:ATP-dependent helicase/nuclease subunit A